ncbi:MAG: hypothetical protein FJ194_12545 [Gammaproteobacteria bacterium]|nr:hypothetical protein [Gammaproteobacteria bacterium]
MGIDVWFERPTASTLAARVAVAERAARSDPNPASVPVPPKRPGGSVPNKGDADSRISHSLPARPVPEVQPTQRVDTEPALAEIPVEPFSLLCFRGAGAILLCVPPQTRNRQRLGRDIVEAASALSAAAGAATSVIEFVYPPQSAGRTTATPPERVLRAFMTRQLTGLSAARVFISADAVIRFEDWFKDPCTVIPSLDELFGDPARKQELWRLLLGDSSG